MKGQRSSWVPILGVQGAEHRCALLGMCAFYIPSHYCKEREEEPQPQTANGRNASPSVRRVIPTNITHITSLMPGFPQQPWQVNIIVSTVKLRKSRPKKTQTGLA